MHKNLVELFENSSVLLEEVTEDYFECVLNILPGEPYHPVEK